MDINRIIKAIFLIIVIAGCIYKICVAAKVYCNEYVVKEDLQSYVSQEQVVIDVVQGGLMSGASNLYEPEITSQPDTETESETEIVPKPVVNQFISDLQDEVNCDVIAWLSVVGTNIGYPVLQADDNEKYLYSDIYNNPSKAGSLFTDYRCASEFHGLSTIIYGHNMKNRSMFGDLRLYSDPDFLKENKYGVLWTKSNTFVFEIFAFLIISSDNAEIYANPSSEREFYEYIKENARVFYQPEKKEKFLVLSTCSYEYDDARIAVVAGMYEIT